MLLEDWAVQVIVCPVLPVQPVPDIARRPQVQERLTMQIADELSRVLKTDDVAVYLDARHMCVESRGVEHHGGATVTTEYRGKFLNENTRREFLSAIEERSRL